MPEVSQDADDDDDDDYEVFNGHTNEQLSSRKTSTTPIMKIGKGQGIGCEKNAANATPATQSRRKRCVG